MLFKAAQIPSLAVVYTPTLLVLCGNILRAAVMRFLNGFIKAPFLRRYNQSRVKLRKLLKTSRHKNFHRLLALSSDLFHHVWGNSQLSCLSCFFLVIKSSWRWAFPVWQETGLEDKPDLHTSRWIWNPYLLVRCCLYSRVKCSPWVWFGYLYASPLVQVMHNLMFFHHRCQPEDTSHALNIS